MYLKYLCNKETAFFFHYLPNYLVSLKQVDVVRKTELTLEIQCLTLTQLQCFNIRRKCSELSVLGITLLSFDSTHRRKFQINKIRDLVFIILYAHYAI